MIFTTNGYKKNVLSVLVSQKALAEEQVLVLKQTHILELVACFQAL